MQYKEPRIVGYRKWMFSLIYGGIILVIASILNFLKIPIDDNLVKVCMVIYLGYLASNLGSKFATVIDKISNLLPRKK